MDKLHLFVPQWQGSGLTKELYEGSHALRSFIEQRYSTDFRRVEIDAGSVPVMKGGILGYDIISRQLKEVQSVLGESDPERVFLLGGGCGIEIPVVSHLARKYPDLTVFWFDAHGDLNSPESSPSGHFHGMPLRFLTDDAVTMDGLCLNRISADRVILMGARDLDVPEENFIEERGVAVLPVNEIRDAASLGRFMAERRGKAYIHIDLDVLDPAHYRNVKCPTAEGVTLDELRRCLEVIGSSRNIAGFSIVENTALEEPELRKLNDIIGFGLSI